MRLGKRGVFTVLLCAAAALSATLAAGANAAGRQATGTVIRVCPSGPPACPYSSIQAAINAASSGDTIAIDTGTYAGGLNTDRKDLTLIGEGRPSPKITGGKHVIQIDSGSVGISKILLLGGGSPRRRGHGEVESGGGVDNNGRLTLSSVTVADNKASSNGGGILNRAEGTLRVINTLVDENHATRHGGGIANYGLATVQDFKVSKSSAASDGGGIFNGADGRLELFRTTVEKNHAGQHGGGIDNEGRVIVNRTLIRDNSASAGGGIYNGTLATRVSLIGSLVTVNTPNNCAPPGSVTGCGG